MGTIGVTRGFGDHDLLAIYQKTPIKPFLSSNPEVQIRKIDSTDEKEVLVMGTDGLWDVVDGKKAVDVVSKSINAFMEKERCVILFFGFFCSKLIIFRYVSAATCLVGSARGTLVNEHSWQLKDGKPASYDDISVFVIPLLPYKLEYDELVSRYLQNSEKQSNNE